MSDSVIQVENLSKRFMIGKRETHATLRDAIARKFAAPFGANGKRGADILWALRDVSFDVKQGEVLGLVGRNGAGKSTLLKILSRITRPTTGWAKVCGRIASLLEVGTGFHPELTGRENVFLNGAILGMSKREIVRKFDEIVAFAEIERFIDTPVKRYSSGMYVRLAFAVAAHLDPDILFVDEVLSVGDLSFQKKCMGKMGHAAQQGRTIVFVSHQMAPIRRLCQRALWLEKGGVWLDASAQEVVSAYEAAMARGNGNGKQDRPLLPDARFVAWEIANPTTDNPYTIDHLGPVTIRVRVEVLQPIRKAAHGIALYNHEHRLIWSKAPEKIALDEGACAFDHIFPMLPLRPGLYSWLVTLFDDEKLVDSWWCEPEMSVTTESHQTPLDEWTGILNLPARFEPKASRAPGAETAGDRSRLQR
jgi:lipopolysaccharide transport system ATP-binding protein